MQVPNKITRCQIPNFRLEVLIEKVSKSDMDYIISQLEDAVGLCNGKIQILKDGENDNLELSSD